MLYGIDISNNKGLNINCYNNPSVTGFVGLSMSYPW